MLLGPISVLLCGQLRGCLLLTKVGVLNLLRFSGFGRSVTIGFSSWQYLMLCSLMMHLGGEAVSDAWMIRSGAAESAQILRSILLGLRR